MLFMLLIPLCEVSVQPMADWSSALSSVSRDLSLPAWLDFLLAGEVLSRADKFCLHGAPYLAVVDSADFALHFSTLLPLRQYPQPLHLQRFA
ncbi:D-serine dehydratase [Fusarium oxysporum f. sp. albedinis]|nr:D-serine dehydratase [Fusarium oxysporum f. sp. albedinis]